MSRPRHASPGQRALSPRLGLLLALCAGLAAALPAGAAGGAWQAIGPSGGVVLGLAVDPASPATVYAAAGGGGLFRTVDGGRSWAHSDLGLSSLYVFRVAVDPAVTTTVYAATLHGFFKSGDAAATWAPATSGLSGFVADLAIDPRTTSTLYAASGSRVFKSVDGAASWFDSGAGLPRRGQVEVLAVDPSRPATLYAGTSLGVFKSVDRGASWRPARVGMGTPDIIALAADPLAPGTVYAAAQASSNSSAAGLFVSADGGATWTAAAFPSESGEPAFCLALSPAAPRAAYACANQGLVKSTDGGRSWVAINRGLGTNQFGGITAFSALAVDPSFPDRLYAGVGEFLNGGPAVYKTASRGAVWRPFSNGIDTVGVTDLAVDPLHAGTLYVGTTNAGVIASSDDGASWAPANRGLRGRTVAALAIDPLAPANLYAETDRGFFASANGGARWSRPGAPFSGLPLIVGAQAPTTLYSFSGSPPTLFKSADGGATWMKGGTIAGGVVAAAISPSAPAILYVAVVRTIYHRVTFVAVSQDGGATFQEIDQAFDTVSALAVDPATASTLYVAARPFSPARLFLDSALYKSTDGGRTVTLLPGISGVQSLLVDPANPALIYAGTTDVLVSRDGGATWSQLAPGLPAASVVQLAFGPAGTLYAGTQGASVYRIAL
ncbi:MAG TPA: hypothetical protein VHR45_12250 [Thermoanaerobaculia bacterium]|nr:hypothetical protein [Thermoanaerobaculia bacterium]